MLVGTDPELFAVRDGLIIPPICVEEENLKRIGTLVSEDPDYHPVYYRDDAIQIIGDGAAFEFNVPPADTPEELNSYWLQAKSILEELLPNDMHIVAKAAQKFDLNYLLETYDITEKRLSYSCRFGCDRQFNVYHLGSTPEVNAKDILWRYAGGHIHISPIDSEMIRPIIFGLDQTVGLVCLFNSPYPEAEIVRQEFYGVPGNYRPQQYTKEISGVEYRTPSVAWLESIDVTKRIFELIPYVVDLVETEKMVDLFTEYNEMAKTAILTYDKDLGEKVMKGMGIL